MSYKHRSGSFRKVKYSLKIIKENDVPKSDFNQLKSTAKHISEEELLEQRSLNSDSEIPKNYPVAEFSLVHDKDLYGTAYANGKMPTFPIRRQHDTVLDDEEEEEYDMDTEDKEWLEKHKEYHITPSRFEFIFKKLNQRNTHVAEKAISALAAPFHKDFHRVFPYWKERRLQKKNISSFPIKKVPSRDAKSASGCVPNDPYVIFTANVPHETPKQKVQHGKKVTLVNDLLKLRNCLVRYKSLSASEISTSIAARGQIEKNLASFESRYFRQYVSLPVTDDSVPRKRRCLGETQIQSLTPTSDKIQFFDHRPSQEVQP